MTHVEPTDRTSQCFAIVPAAGRSLRMGTDKLLLKWQGKTLIEHHLDAWLASGIDRVIVVTRATALPLIDLLRRYRGSLDAVLADPPPADMKQSVQLALTRIATHYQPRPRDAWLLAPADMPRLNTRVIDRLCEQHRIDPSAIRIPVAAGRRGHPALFPWPLAQAVLDLNADEGVNAIVARTAPAEMEVDDDDILLDVDTLEAFLELQRRT